MPASKKQTPVFYKRFCVSKNFLTRTLQVEGVHPAGQSSGNDFSALRSEKSPCPTGKAGRYDEK